MEEVREAFTEAYDEDTLDEMLRFRLEKKLFKIVPKGSLNTIVFKLLDKATMEGWETKLIREAYRFNPGSEHMLRIYEKYGMAPQIALQREGQPLAGGETRKGLEKTISDDIPVLDIVKLRTRLSDFEVRICRVERNQAGAGTGFLIGPDVVLTNYHVVEKVLNGTHAESAVTCLFDYKRLADNSVQTGLRVKLHPAGGILVHSPYTPEERALVPDKTLPTEQQLDFALLRLERPLGSEPLSGPDSPKRGFEKLPDTAPVFTPDEGLLIAQHPAGEPMKIALDTRSVIGLNANGTRVRYRTNTEGGASGSPVFDMRCQLVALHHYGDPALDHPPQYNQGVAPLHLIRAMIAAAGHGALLG